MVNCLAISVLIGLIFTAICFLFLSGRYSYTISGKHIRLFVNTKTMLFETDERFLSFGLDTSFLGCMFQQLKPDQWKKLELYASLLSPAYIRVGGKQTDTMDFSRNNSLATNFYQDCNKGSEPKNKLLLTGDRLIKLFNFSRTCKLRLVMSLNLMVRIRDRGERGGTLWNSTNSQDLLKYSESKMAAFDVQLANGPENRILPKQLASDYNILRAILDRSNNFVDAKAVGPDVTIRSLKFLGRFLSRTEGVDVVSWKQYYIESGRTTMSDFVNTKTLEKFSEDIKSVKGVVDGLNKSLPIWLTETSAVQGGGGVPGLSDRYVSVFMWLDKLGMAAKYGIAVVVRQFLFKDSYSLISPHFTPSLDFWIAIFYKRLVGRQVLNVEFKNTKSKALRFYAHCLSRSSPVKGEVVVFGMNLANKSEIFLTVGMQFRYPIYSFIFRPANIYDVTSRNVLLNNKPLDFNYKKFEEPLKNPMSVKLPLIVPSFSINFWIFKEKSDALAKSICGKPKENRS